MREEKVRKLDNSPLVFVLAQVRFSPLEAMEKYLPNIQDRLRQCGFPVNLSGVVREIRLSNTETQVAERKRWEFQSKDHCQSIIIDKGFLTLQTTTYDVFENFLDIFGTALDVVAEEVNGLLVTRIGLRYINVIQPQETEFVRKGIRGLESELFKTDTEQNIHQTLAQTSAGIIAVRLIQNREGHTLPPDLIHHTLEEPCHTSAPKQNELLTIIDVDHFNQNEFDYDRKKLERMAWELKNQSYKVIFEHVFTKHAVDMWEKK